MIRGKGKSEMIWGKWMMIWGRWIPIALFAAIPIAGGCVRTGTGLPWHRPTPDLAAAAADTAAFLPDTSAVLDSRYEPDFEDEVTTLVEPPPARHEATTPPTPSAPPPRPAADTTRSEPPVAPPTISLAIPEAQRIRLTNAFRIDAGAADSLRAVLEPQVKSVSGKEKLQTAADLLVQARAAMEAQNLEAAANLAHKARLLVQELLPR